MHATRILAIVLAAALGVVLLRLATARRGAPPAADGARSVSFTEEIMAAPITVLLPEADAASARLVFDVFRDVDAAMSEWKASSPLSAVNAAAGRTPVTVPDDLRAVIRRGVEIGDLTGGAFDVTWAALWGLWDFKAASPAVPAADDIAARVALVGYDRVAIDDEAGTVFLPEPGMLIGLGGIAKGHALDRAAATLRARGIRSFLVSAAGQMMAGGRREGRPWRIGIRDPRGGIDDFFALVEASDVSVSTSGDYERYFVIDGVRYHHILDPRTGRPARSGVRSATVVSADATLADALSTAVFILGVERGLSLVERLDGVEAVIVDDEATVHVSSGLHGRLSMRHAPAP